MYVATGGSGTSSSPLITPAGWTVLANGNQGGVYWTLLKVDGVSAPGSISMQLTWGQSQDVIEGVLFRWFGGDGGGTWGHIVGPTYNLAPGSNGYSEWTSPGGAVRHSQVMHGTNTYAIDVNQIPDAGGPLMGVGHYQRFGSYSGTALDNWQANPASGPITWGTIGAFGGSMSSSFAFVWTA